MLSSFLPIGAGLALRSARAAIVRGDLDAASAACRVYIASKLPSERLPLRGLAARVAALAALCATSRGDLDEVIGAAELVEGAGDRATAAARETTGFCMAALDGDIGRALEEVGRHTARWPALEGPVVLGAVERAIDHVPPSRLADIEARLGSGPRSPALQARAALVLARIATLQGEPARALEALSAIPEHTTPAYQVLAGMARGDVSAAIEAAGKLRPKERDAALGFGASLVLDSDSEASGRLLDELGDNLSGPVRSTLAATRAITLARSGAAAEAVALLESLRETASAMDASKDGSPAIALSAAYVALLAGDAAKAKEALRDAGDTGTAAPLRLIALALGDDHAELVSELRRHEQPPPGAYASALHTLVLAALARTMPLPDKLPSWLQEPPEDPPGVYAWGLVRLAQGAAEDAAVALEEAVSALPDLAALGDAPDVARLAAAASLLARGESEKARDLAAAVKSPRLGAAAGRLQALAIVQRRAADRSIRLEAEMLPGFVADMARAGTRESVLVEPLLNALGLMRVRSALRNWKTAEARVALDRFHATEAGARAVAGEDPEVAFLVAALDVCEGGAPLEQIEAAVARATEKAPEHGALHALRAELSIALHGKDAGISMLEAAHGKVQGAVLEQALASAYQGANRGLDAKRVGFATLRKATGSARRGIVTELGRILAFEAAPRGTPRDDTTVKRRPPAEALPASGLLDRVPVLFAHAGAAGQRNPSSHPQIEELVQKMKRALIAEDTPGALSVEKDLFRLCRRARA
jgi:tetratricopeptide (TPR) repeat protein